jgi:hypothetical protein
MTEPKMHIYAATTDKWVRDTDGPMRRTRTILDTSMLLNQSTTIVLTSAMLDPTPDARDMQNLLACEIFPPPPVRQDSPFGWILPRIGGD